MVEMTVEDVLVQFDEERPGEQRVILLRERKGERVLPIWVGSAEGNALALHLGSELPLRPLTVDLAAKLLEVTGARVERVVISRLHENTFYASIGLVTAGEAAEVDARPSDALNLAVRVGAPIYVEDAVLGEAALAECELPGRLDCEAEKAWGPERQSGEWRPLPPSWRSPSTRLRASEGAARGSA